MPILNNVDLNNNNNYSKNIFYKNDDQKRFSLKQLKKEIAYKKSTQNDVSNSSLSDYSVALGMAKQINFNYNINNNNSLDKKNYNKNYCYQNNEDIVASVV